MVEICFCDNKRITLSTGMDEAGFGKTRLAVTLPSEFGLMADFSADAEKPDFIPFTFTGIYSDTNGYVNLYSELAGKIPDSESLQPLSTLLGIPGGTAEKSAMLAVKAITCALSRGQKLDPVGAGGILAGKNFVIFLPKNLFECCLNSREKKTQAELNGNYLFKGLSQENGLCFLRAVIAYKALARKFPFAEVNEEARQKDIIDSLFLPLEYAVNGIDENLALCVNDGLSPKVNFTDESQKNFPLQVLQNELGLCKDGTYTAIFRKNAVSEGQFKKLSESYFNKKNSKTMLARFVQKNKIALTVIGSVFFILILSVNSFLNRLENLPTTRGLNSVETIGQFYKAIHTLDVELLQETGKGGDLKGVENVVSAMYVTNKTREGYSNERTVTPEKWFSIAPKESYRQMPLMYGLTDVLITDPGKRQLSADLVKNAYARKDKPAVAAEDDGLLPEEGDIKKYTVAYYRVFTYGEDAVVNIEKTEDYIMETFAKKRWLVTSVSSKVISAKEIPMQKIYNAYEKAFEENKGNFEKTRESLRTVYEWIP